MNNEIENLYKKSAEILRNIKILKAKLRLILPKPELDSKIVQIKNVVCKNRLTKVKTIEGKIKNLIKAQKKTHIVKLDSHQFYPRMINLTKIEFDKKESDLLGKWTKFNPYPYTKNN